HSVARIAARYTDRVGRRRVYPLVVKHLRGDTAREALVYSHLLAAVPAEIAPRMLATQRLGCDGMVLYLEAIRRTTAWPWKDIRAIERVLHHVARLHEVIPSRQSAAALDSWNYEVQLSDMASLTVERLENLPRNPDLAHIRRGARWTRRLATALPGIRRELLAFPKLGRAPIHGDLHTGNVMMRRRHGRDETVILDWGRARFGSPLEDVSSWLQSLGLWDAEARRRHDTLLASYLSSRGMDRRLGSDLRAAYWLAGASNALAGALLYQLTRLTDEKITPVRRARAISSALQWLRILRRADAMWS
ncbi:MAG TPA: phosphotransferase, partial [Gemmatimonadales bacterium]|nr:phosphotransferase [Gemmatimonadales bacterium]